MADSVVNPKQCFHSYRDSFSEDAILSLSSPLCSQGMYIRALLTREMEGELFRGLIGRIFLEE